MKIVQDEQFLRQKSEPATFDEAAEIADQLITTLTERNDGDVGLAAPQIGILKQVCVVRAKETLVLVNPRIVETEGITWYQEGCLSFPGKSVKTCRHKSIVVECDYLGTGNDKMIEWQENAKVYFSADDRIRMEDDKNLLESVAVQHEVDHVNGILFFDRMWKNDQRTSSKVGRNDPCPCGSGKKYKKCCERI